MLLWVFSFYFQNAMCFAVYKIGWSEGLQSCVYLSWTEVNGLVLIRRPLNSPFRDFNK